VHVLTQIVLVATGSALGGLLRWGIGVACGHLFGASFPWGTLFINVSGSLFLGWFSTVLSQRYLAGASTWLRPEDVQLLVAVGFTGAYTTFSTFEFEADKLWRDGHGLLSLAYLATSVVLGLAAVRVGILLAHDS
jgi:fluoride exporter